MRDSIIITILRCGIYQILYMESVPDNAAVNESVALAKKFGKTSASGMVNAILRNFIRQGKKIDLPGEGIARLSVEYSVPPELVQCLIADHGIAKAEDFLRFSLEKPVTYLRMNHLRCTEEELLAAAFAAAPRRIVVKRPIKGEPLAGKKPGFSIDCRNVRYDCHVVRA